MIRYCFACICALLGFYSTQAQNHCDLSVQFWVSELHNNAALADAVLSIEELKWSIQTDEEGKATLDHICPGTYRVHIHSAATEDTTFSVGIEQSGSIRLKVKHAAHILHQIVVRDKNEKTIIQSKEQLDKQSIQENAGKTLAEMLKNINGLSTLSNGATVSKPVIHGLHSNRILMLNNGVRQEDQQWGVEHAPDIDPFIANNITVLKGAAGVRYGTDAMGGVVLVSPKPIRDEAGWGGNLNLAAFSNNRMGVASAMIEHRLRQHPEFSFRVQGTLKKGGNYQIPGGYWVANSGVREQNASATFAYRGVHWGSEVYYSRFSNTIGIYTGSHTGSQQDLENAINSPTPLVKADFTYQIGRPKQVVSHDLLKLKTYWDQKWGVWNFVYAFQHNFRQEYDVVRVDNGNAQLNLTLNTHTFNINLDHKKWGNFSGQVGVDGLYQHNTFREGDRVFIPSYYALGAAIYAIEHYTHNNWVLEAGLRFDYKHYDMFNPQGAQLNNVLYQFDYKNPSGTIAFKQNIKPHWQWQASLANSWRAPQAQELFSSGLHQGGARIELGDKDLKPEQALGLNISSTYELEGKLKLEASVYSQSIQNFIYLKPGENILTIKGYYKTFNYVQTNAQLSGTDLSANYTWCTRFHSEAKVSLLRAWDRSQKDWLLLMPSDRFSFGTRYTFDLSKNVSSCFVGIDASYVLQQKRVPANFDQIDYPRPPGAYFLLNASAGLQVNWRHQPLIWSLSVSNLTNTKYRDYLDLFRYFIDQPGMNMALRLNVPFN